MFKRFLACALALTMVLGCVPVSAAEPDEAVTSALQLYYDFDDVTGTTVPDKSGNGNDGTLLNNASVVDDVQASGNVLSLENTNINGGTAQGLNLPAALFAGMGDTTIVMDVKLDNSKTWSSLLVAGTNQQNYMVLANQGDPSGIGPCGITSATKLNNATEQRIWANSATKLPTGQWARMAFTQSANGASALYIDNVQVASGTLTTLQTLAGLTGGLVRIGNNHVWPDPGLEGRVDNVRVYNTVLTAEQMETIPWEMSNASVGEVEFPELGEHGLKADFYLLNSDRTFGEYKSTYIDKNIDFADMETIIAARAGASDSVAARWTGRIAAPETGNYTFYAYSDNGVRVWIDDQLIIDWWVTEWDVEQVSAKVAMEKGVAHNIKVEWLEDFGGSHITVSWKNDQTLSKQAIPASAFYLPDGFEPPIVNVINTDEAQLDRGQGATGGVLKLEGENLADVTEAEIVSSSGTSLSTPIYAEIVEATDSVLSVQIPDNMRAGYYILKLKAADLTTTTKVGFTVLAAEGEHDRAEHPRPDWQRTQWMNLNGWWDFAFDEKEVGLTEGWSSPDKAFDLKINVPFPWESELSGIGNTTYRGQVWYQRTMTLDESWLAEGKTVHLYFGAVDAKCIVYVNGQEVGSHNGGYTQFEFDITDYVNVGDNTITLWVEDKASYGDDSYPALVGKQGHNAPCGYTHNSGIWQTVYLEGRTETYLNYAHANQDIDNSSVTYDLSIESAAAQNVSVKYSFVSKLWNEAKGIDEETGSAFTGSQEIALTAGTNEITLDPIVIENVKLWSDKEANLYYGTIQIVAEDNTVLDNVDTYFGMREITLENYAGRDYQYINLNGEPIFLSGLLDQGFWAEGIYTAPSEEALKYDISSMKELGFNMIRKHLKIEDPLQYYWCDKLGMFFWQDMPHATAMNTTVAGGATPGREIYEEALYAALDRDYNHPSVIQIILFNETWGINHNGTTSSDGMDTHQWMEYLYNQVKSIHPGMPVEDMSACNQDHIQPTDVNTFHMYPNGYTDTKNIVAYYADNAYPWSGNNFWSWYQQEGEPFLNSEYGGVGAYDGDYDVSLCFKYMTDIQRMYEKLNGYVYTEPYDIEYERNGILTYDRRNKLFPYDEIAYGGDMTMVDLNQPNYVGVDAEPARTVVPGGVYSADAVAVNWSGDVFTDAVLKWRFDATDVYGNALTTDLSGEFAISYPAYTAERRTISFNVPNEKCVGTLTVWIESNGEKVAKNFVNVIVSGNTANVELVDDDTVALRDSSLTKQVAGTGTITYEYTVPTNFNLDDLNSIRVIAEASSMKASSINNGITNSEYSQTTEGSERPSDMTVAINGVEVDTVYLPDNPRDIRGTLTFDEWLAGGDSAGNFGYLVNINVPSDKIAAVQEAIANDGEIVVTYSVKADAQNKNGLRIYDDNAGRYAVKPTIILNPNDLTATDGDITPNADNYLVTSTLSDGDSVSVRGGIAEVTLKDGVLTLGDESVEVGAGDQVVTVRVFDDHYQVYVNNDPVPVIDLYDYTEYTDTTVVTTGADLVVSPDKSAEGEVPDEDPEVKLPFEDVAEDAWYYDVVYYNYVNGYMTGKSDTIFAPDATLTRAELTSILYRINGEPEVTYEAKFTDVPADAWYAAPIIWASQQGVVNGYAEGDFKPDNAITREQLAVIMHNYATSKGYATNQSADLSAYNDADQVSGWAAPAVQWAVATGVLSGKNGVSLDPLGNATRAEAAAIIQRFMENIAK